MEQSGILAISTRTESAPFIHFKSRAAHASCNRIEDFNEADKHDVMGIVQIAWLEIAYPHADHARTARSTDVKDYKL
jgi:hypothetical protein